MGCSVADTSGVGDGFPDLVAGYGGQNFMFEIKDPAKPLSRRKMTVDQVIFHAAWRGQVAVIHTLRDALEIMGRRG